MTCYRQNPEVACQVFDEEAVLIASRSSEMYSLNRTATVIWQALERSVTAADLAAAMAQVFEVEPAHALRDVTGFLEDFVRRDLVQVVGP